jgi:hypothetical protein
MKGGQDIVKTGNQTEIYQLKITLKYVRPQVWRRAVVLRLIGLERLRRLERLKPFGTLRTAFERLKPLEPLGNGPRYGGRNFF